MRLATHPLRFVVFGESIISEYGNPAATSWRELLASLAELGHDVTFLELRNNTPTVGLLHARGSEFQRAFARAFPTINYRTYELPHRSLERSVWFGREMATVDAVIALNGAPPEVLEDIARWDEVRLVRVANSSPGNWDITLTTSDGQATGTLPFGPAARILRNVQRVGIGVVAYDNICELDLNAGELASAWNTDLSGTCGEGWGRIPEAELPAKYASTADVLLLSGSFEGDALGRLLLLLANGCRVILPAAVSLPSDLQSRVEICPPERLSELLGDRPSAVTDHMLPARYDARRQAATLATEITRQLVSRKVRRS